jgi:hypothetical protein
MASRRAVLPMLALLCSAALAGEGPGPYSFTLSGKAFDERCLHLDAGQSIQYRFKASAPVDFNIHYHRGNDVFFPVKKSGVREANGTFKAERADGYCLMWEHKGNGSSLVGGTLERNPKR